MAETSRGGLGTAFLALTLGAPFLGMLILILGVLFPSLDAPWVATLVAFPVLILGLLVAFPLTRSEKHGPA